MVLRLGLGTCPSTSRSLSHSFTITCTCCFDEIKGTQHQDLFSCSVVLTKSKELKTKIYSHAHSLKLSRHSVVTFSILYYIYRLGVQGEWVRGRRHGYGQMVSFGNTYTGQWKENETWKQGELLPVPPLLSCACASFSVLAAPLFILPPYSLFSPLTTLLSLFVLTGTILFSNGDKYSGQWSNGVMNGQGKMEFANNGDNYEGEWRDNKRHGQGTYTYAGGGWSSSEWYKGVEQTPTAVEALLQAYRLEAFLQPILDIGVYAPLDMLPIVSDDLVSIGMQSVHMKQFKWLCDQLRLRQDPDDSESELTGGTMPRPRGRHFAHNHHEES